MTSAVINATSDDIVRTASLPEYNAHSTGFWFKVSSSQADFSLPRLWFAMSPGYAWYSGVHCVVYPVGYPAQFLFTIGGSGGTVTGTTGGALMERETWYYAGISCGGNGTNANKLYIWGGTDVGSRTLLESLAYTSSGSGTLTVMRLGGTDNADAATDMLGKVAYGRVWARALSQADFEAEMFLSSVVSTTNIYSAFAGDPATDTSGQSHPWTLTTIAVDDADTPPVTSGGPTPIVMTWAL